MKHKKLIVLIVLAVLAVASLIYGIKTPSKALRSVTPEGASLPASSYGIPQMIASPRKAPRTDFQEWGKNPFLSKEFVGEPTDQSLVLNGIAWDEKNPTAVINNKIARLGSRIANHKVIKIESDRVLLSDGFREFELRLGRKKRAE